MCNSGSLPGEVASHTGRVGAARVALSGRLAARSPRAERGWWQSMSTGSDHRAVGRTPAALEALDGAAG